MKLKRHWITLAVCALLIAGYSHFILTNLKYTPSRPDGLRCFGSFWVSGWAAAHHLNPYADSPLIPRVHPFPWSTYTFPDVNLNPPAFLPFLQIISAFNLNTGVYIWTIFSILAIVAAAAMLMFDSGIQVQRRQIAWLLLCPATIDTLSLGQTTTFLALLAVIAWLLLKADREVAAGICLGILAAFKPNFAVWPWLLLFAGARRTAYVATITLVAASLLPLVLYGGGVYVDWIRATAHDQHAIFPTNISLLAFGQILGVNHFADVGAIGLIALSTLAIYRSRSTVSATGMGLALAILCSPVGWIHYSLMLAPFLFSFRWSARFSCVMLPLLLPIPIGIALRSLPHPGASLLVRCWYLLPIAATWAIAAHQSWAISHDAAKSQVLCNAAIELR